MNWGRMSRAERDAAYNNATAVANSRSLIAERNERAALFRAKHNRYLDLSYGPAERRKWDLFPGPESSAPCLVFIHGGYWQMNRREDFAHFAEGVAAHGWSVAMPGYTLAPEASLTTIIAELTAALDWLAQNGSAVGIRGEIYLTGWSAGGHLTAMLLKHPLVTAGLAISGVFELGPIRDTYLNEKLQLTDDEIVLFSPLRLSATPKPLAIAYGTAELPALVEDSRNLHALRAAAHQPGILLPVAGANHFSILDALLSPAGSIVGALRSLHGRTI
jgi:acetyl esterase/lipase